MKITLLDVQGKKDRSIYKDWAGGFGTSFSAGDSFFAKIIEFLKKTCVNLPLTTYGYLAAIFEESGHEVEYIKNKLPEDSDLTIINSSIVDCKTELKFAKMIKEGTSSKLGLIGPFSAQVPEFYKKYADFIVKGEPDRIAMKIAKGWIPKGVVISEPIKNLDEIPFPNWDTFPVKSYKYYPSLKKRPLLPVLASRGCSYMCNYCPYKVQWNFRSRSVSNIINEIKYLKETYRIRGIVFRDPLFSHNMKKTEKLGKEMIRNKLDIEWGCETRTDHLSIHLLKTLYDAGLRTVNIGVESFYDEIISIEKRKPISKEHQEKIVDFCDKIGIKITAFFIIGLPTDTVDTIKKTIEYAKFLNANVSSFCISTPFPGTEFYKKVKDKIYANDWEEFTTYNAVYEHPNLSRKQLLKLKELAFISYFFRTKYILKFLQRSLR